MTKTGSKTLSKTSELPAIREMGTVKFDLPFTVLCIVSVINYLKPEFLIPGLSSIGILRQAPNILMFFLFIIWLREPRKVLHNTQTKLFLAFLLLMAIDTLLARNPSLAFTVTKSFTIMVIGYFVRVHYINSLPRLRLLIQIFLFSTIVMAFQGIKGGGLIRSIPALCDENDFALLMNMVIPFAYFSGIGAQSFAKKLSFFGIAGLFMAGAVVSLSRGGFIGLACTLLYCFYKTQKKSIAIVLAIIVALLAFSFAPQKYWDEIYSIKTEGASEGTGAKRVHYWGNALKMFADFPILGVGQNNSGVWIMDYDQSGQGARDWGRALHSVYFTLLSELGLVGTFLFLAFIYYGEKNKKFILNLYKQNVSLMKKNKNPDSYKKYLSNQIREEYLLSISLTGALIGFLSSGIFLSVLYYGWFWMIATFTAALFNIANDSAKQLTLANDMNLENGRIP